MVITPQVQTVYLLLLASLLLSSGGGLYLSISSTSFPLASSSYFSPSVSRWLLVASFSSTAALSSLSILLYARLFTSLSRMRNLPFSVTRGLWLTLTFSSSFSGLYDVYSFVLSASMLLVGSAHHHVGELLSRPSLHQDAYTKERSVRIVPHILSAPLLLLPAGLILVRSLSLSSILFSSFLSLSVLLSVVSSLLPPSSYVRVQMAHLLLLLAQQLSFVLVAYLA